MKKVFRILTVAILAFSLLISSSFITSAADEDYGIMPCYSNVITCIPKFEINSSGDGIADVRYNAISSVFREARISVKIEKQFLWFFWTEVDIGYSNNEWTASSTDVNGRFYNSFDLDGSGTYRAVFTIEFIGTNGSVDTIEDTIEKTY